MSRDEFGGAPPGGGFGGGGFGGGGTPPGGGFGGGGAPPGGGFGGGTPLGGGFGGGGAPPGGGFGGGTPPGGPGGYGPPGGYPPGGGGYPPGGHYSGVTAGDLLSTSISIVGRNFGTYLLIAMACGLPGTAMSSYGQAQLGVAPQMLQNAGPEMFSEMLTAFLTPFLWICGGALLSILFTGIAQALLMFSVVENLSGRKPNFMQTIHTGMGRVIPALGAMFLQSLLIAAVYIPVAILVMLPIAFAIGSGSDESAAMMGVCTACVGVPIIFGVVMWVYVLLFLAVPSAVVEGGAAASIARSIELTRGHRWKIFGALAALIAMLFVLSCLTSLCTGSMAAPFMSSQIESGYVPQTPTWMIIFQGVISWVVGAIFLMMIASLAAVTYARIRGIRDGVDAGKLAQVFS